MPEPPTTYSWLSSSLHVADVCVWLDFVISVIVLIIQSQLERGKKTETGKQKRREKDEAGISAVALAMFYFHFALLQKNELQQEQTKLLWDAANSELSARHSVKSKLEQAQKYLKVEKGHP